MKSLYPRGKYPEAFYRVSVKAIIRRIDGTILCVREHNSEFSLPGGGLIQGESVHRGLARELSEEVAPSREDFTERPIGLDAFYVQHKNDWQMWALYEVEYPELPEFAVGEDGDEIAWIDPRSFKDSKWLSQRAIYKWCVDTTYDIGIPIGY